MTVTKIAKYRGASILILNEWQCFIYVIFYKGEFFANQIVITKSGEYTNKEYLQAMDGALTAAKSTIDTFKERSLINKFNPFNATNRKRLRPNV